MLRPMARSNLAFGILLFIVGFSPALQARPLDAIGVNELSRRLKGVMDLTGAKFQEGRERKDWLGGCIRSELQMELADPVNGRTRKLQLDLVRPADVDGPVPLVVVVPTIEGSSFLEGIVTDKFCDAGMATIVADVNENVPPKLLPAWDLENQNNRFAGALLRSVLDYAERNPHFDKNRLAMMGLSLGGISTAMMAGIEPNRLRAVVITVGGGNLPFILTTSTNGRVSDMREQRMDYLGWTDLTRYEDQLRTSIEYDPIYFAPRAVTNRIYMVMAENDKSVPSIVQQELFKAFGQPNSMSFRGGHITSILGLTFLYMNEVIQFIESRFETDHRLLPREPVHRVIDLDKLPPMDDPRARDSRFTDPRS